MNIENNDGTTNTQTRNDKEKLVSYIDLVGYRTRDLFDDDTMKTGLQAIHH